MVGKWYIWLSLPAFVLLGNVIMLQCLIPRKGCLLLVIKCMVMLTALGGSVAIIVVLANEFPLWLESPFGTILMWLTLYFVGVLATYLLTLWREKNMPHLRKSKGKEK